MKKRKKTIMSPGITYMLPGFDAYLQAPALLSEQRVTVATAGG